MFQLKGGKFSTFATILANKKSLKCLNKCYITNGKKMFSPIEKKVYDENKIQIFHLIKTGFHLIKQ